MKKKTLDELKIKSIEWLSQKIADLEKEKTNELLELRVGKVKNVHAAGNKRKEIATLKTIIRMKQIILEKQPSAQDEKADLAETKNHVTS